MTLDLGNQTVDVLRAVHPRHNLCVRFDEQTLETVITFLQQSAWSTDAMKKKRQDVPTDAPGSNNFLSLHLLGGNEVTCFVITSLALGNEVTFFYHFI